MPYAAAAAFVGTLRDHDVQIGLLRLDKVKHIHDMKLKPGSREWKEGLNLAIGFC